MSHETDKRLLGPDEAADLLQVPRPSASDRARARFWRAITQWNVPRYRLGPKTVRFSKEDIVAWLESRRVGGAFAR